MEGRILRSSEPPLMESDGGGANLAAAVQLLAGRSQRRRAAESLSSLLHKKSRLKAIEAGAVCTLIELLPDSNKSKCEEIMMLIKLLCECAEGRLAFIEHGLGIAAISKKMLNVSSTATKLGVKILWLICSSNPTEKVGQKSSSF